MDTFARKLIRALPDRPGARYTIYAGTNDAHEWRSMVGAWLRGERGEDMDVIRDYEARFAGHVGAQHGISFGAGRMAFYALLEAMDVGEGSEVILPAFTCVVVPNAVLYRRARPVYVDIEPRSFNIDVDQVEAAITPRTRVLVAQHTFGVPCNVEALREIGRRHGVPVIEDAAHALGACIQGKPVGSLTHAAFVSTDHSKMINTHLGGMAVTSDAALASRLGKIQERAAFLGGTATRRLLRSFLAEYACFSPRLFWCGRSVHQALVRLGFHFYFLDELKTAKPTEYPYPARLSSPQAWLGLSQLDRFDRNISHRRRIAAWLESRIGWYGMCPESVDACAWLRYSFLVKDRSTFEARFYRRFDLGIWFTSVVAGRTDRLQSVGYQPGSCPVAERAARHIVNFPTHPRIPLEAIQFEVERNWTWLADEILDAPRTPLINA